MMLDALRRAGLALAALAMTAGPSHAADAPTPDVRGEIEAMLQSVDKLVKAHAPINEIAEAFYERDLLITGEGEKGLYRSRDAFMKPLQAFVEGGSGCTLKIVDPLRHSGSLAAAFVSEHCKAQDSKSADSDSRVLYVFRKGVKGWRVTMEMYGDGAI
jgi:ketosteroid isomerase-like protein